MVLIFVAAAAAALVVVVVVVDEELDDFAGMVLYLESSRATLARRLVGSSGFNLLVYACKTEYTSKVKSFSALGS